MIPLVLSPRQPRWFSSVYPSCGGGVRGCEIAGSFGPPLWCSNPGAVTRYPQDLVGSVDDLLKNSGDLESLDQSSKHVTVTHLLSGLEQILRTLAKAMPKGSFTYRSLDNTGETTSSPAQPPRTPSHTRSPRSLPPLFSELSLVVQEQGKGNVTVGQSHARMLLDWAVAAAAEESGNGRHPERALQGKGGRS